MAIAPSEVPGSFALSSERLLGLLRRAHAGEDPDIILAEEWANAHHGSLRDWLEMYERGEA
jgi:hypothetical protein